jgi:hypothetical protein
MRLRVELRIEMELAAASVTLAFRCALQKSGNGRGARVAEARMRRSRTTRALRA